MAKITDTSLSWFGSKYNSKQMRIAVPGGPAANTGGVIFLECINSGGAPTGGLYLCTDGTNLRISTTDPTNTNTAGDALGISTGANTVLSNLGAVAINTSLISDAVNTDDLGSDALPWKRLYIRTSLIFDQATRNLTITASEPGTSARTVNFGDPGADDSVAYLAASQALTTKTYNGLTVTCATNAISLVSGTSSIVLAAGNTDVILGAAAQLDIAAAKTVNIDNDVTIQGDFTVSTTVTLNQALATTSSPTFNALTVTSITDGTATMTSGALSGITTIGTTGAVTCRGITNTNTAIGSTAEIGVNADNVYLTVGASGSTDSRIYFDGDDLVLWDSKVGGYTLQQLATGTTLNPTVSGDFTILDGKLTWNDAADEVAAVWTFAGVANDSIQIVAASQTTGNVLSLTANSVTTNGALFYLASSLTAGYFAEFYNGSANVFTVGRYGATVIKGNAAATAALTLTTGDVKITSGYIDSDSPVGDGGHNFATADDGTSSTPFFTITNSGTAFDQPLVYINSDATGAYNALNITHDSTGYGLSIVGTAATGKQAYFAGPAAQTTSIVTIYGSTGAGWDGADGVGMLNLSGVGAHAHANASLLNIADATNACIGSARGSCLRIVDTTTNGADSFVAYISTTNNDGLLLETGQAADINLKLSSSAAGTGQMLLVDGATGTWVGANTVGQVEITGDGVLAAGANMLRVAHATGAPTAASYLVEINGAGTWAGSTAGTCLRVVDGGAVAGTSSAVYIASTANNGLNIVTTAVAASNIILAGPASQAAAMLDVNGATGAWVGAANVGMVHLTSDGTAADVASSLLYIGRSGTGLAANLGSSLRINDSTTAVAGAYVAYMTSASNSVLNLVTAAVGKSALVITGPASQTAAAVTIGGAAIGWVGGAAVGMLQLDSNGALVADASLLKVTNATQPAVPNDGICGEFIDTGVAQATSYAVRIASTNNEALHVDAGLAVFDEGPIHQYSASAATDAAPKIGELNTAFSIAAAAGFNGFVGVLYDSTGAFGGYLCFIANGVWYFATGTLAVV